VHKPRRSKNSRPKAFTRRRREGKSDKMPSPSKLADPVSLLLIKKGGNMTSSIAEYILLLSLIKQMSKKKKKKKKKK
jgi:hypothetical protein